jgi:hypothetical protein
LRKRAFSLKSYQPFDSLLMLTCAQNHSSSFAPRLYSKDAWWLRWHWRASVIFQTIIKRARSLFLLVEEQAGKSLKEDDY